MRVAKDEWAQRAERCAFRARYEYTSICIGTADRGAFLGAASVALKPAPLSQFSPQSPRLLEQLGLFLLFVLSLPAEFIANDRPLLIRYDDRFYMPVLFAYPETVFGGDFETEAEYRDPFVIELIEEKGWIVWPPIPYRYDSVNYDLKEPAPSKPDGDNWLGTDDQARDVAARLIYGYRISILFGLLLTLFSATVGIAACAVQGYFGGWVDLIFQRFIEIWQGMPMLYLLIILARCSRSQCL